MSKEEIWNNFIDNVFSAQVVSKTIVPALIGVMVSLATKMSREKLTKKSVLTSTIIGVGLAYLTSDLIYENLGERWAAATLGAIGIFGDRISHYLVFDLEIKAIGDTIANKLKDIIKKW